MQKKITLFIVFIIQFFGSLLYANSDKQGTIYGVISASDNEPVFATVFLKGTTYGATPSPDGSYQITAPAGNYILVVSSIGYETVEKEVMLSAGQSVLHHVTISANVTELAEVVVSASAVNRINQSAYNAVAIDTRALQNTTQNLGNVLARVPGARLRESGGVGSDMQLMLDGFSGRHVKVFIDGVPLEGVGASFGLNNIPVNFAERIEVYKGVVPVRFGTDAIGGIVNIVTKQNQSGRDRWFLDVSYSYGSFNTHKSYINFGKTYKNGLTCEINAFQNYSDNSYYIYTRVNEFLEDGLAQMSREEFRVKRFHDTYHNEAITGKIGIVGKKWADRLMFEFKYAQMYNEIQNGVQQEIVFGGKYRRGHTLTPSLEYSKRNLFTNGLDVRLTAGYNKNQMDNVDTAQYQFNWFGEKRLRTSPGEQTFQHTRQYNDNWNGTLNLNYRIGIAHLLTFNHAFSAFSRNSKDMLIAGATVHPIPNKNRKSVSGLSYRLMPSERWNASIFGKYYTQFASGLTQETNSVRDLVQISRSKDYFGYGATGTYFIMNGLQAKLSYENACRMPTNNEMFGDGDLESGSSALKPENSHNFNFSLGYDKKNGNHSIFAEGGFIYRNTRDYIMRRINSSGTGGTSQGQHINHGRVLIKGYNISARYGFSNWLSVGGSFTQMNARNNVRITTNGNQDVTYGSRMPNLPYLFANTDAVFYWYNFGRKGNVLTFTYDNTYMHSFPLNFENIGYSDEKRFVPEQFSHNIAVSYSMKNGRYNLSFECQNLTDERLYDSFSLQKAGRAFYGKLRVYFGS